MTNGIQAASIVDEVRIVLRDANRGKGAEPQFLSAYQILDRLPTSLRDQMIAEYGMPGSGAGLHHTAAGVVRNAILHHMRDEVRVENFDNGGVVFEVAGKQVRGGYQICGLYRLNPPIGAEV